MTYDRKVAAMTAMPELAAAGADADREALFQRLIEIGIALSSERNHDRLLEIILLEAKALTRADGGTLYLRTDDGRLAFAIMRNDTLNTALGGTTGENIPFPPLPMFDDSGQPNHKNVATHCALTGEVINIPDAYDTTDFDFSGTRKFDSSTGYRSMSFLTVPLKNHESEVIGVLQLINARTESNQVGPFSAEVQRFVEALASQAAVAIDNQQLLQSQRRLLESFIEVIARAIDAKSPYTSGHCQRVPAITKMLALAACETEDGMLKDFDLDEDGWYELHIAAWLHDCGKVTTPEYVVDKATKLETIDNRIHEIRNRFEILRRDAEIAYWKALHESKSDEATLKQKLDARIRKLEDDFAFVAECNVGGEFMKQAAVDRLKQIAAETFIRHFDRTLGLSWEEEQKVKEHPVPAAPAEENLLQDRPHHLMGGYNHGELYNLSIPKGTLTAEERQKINDHIVVTIEMLEALPFPRHLRQVPEYAGGHHEKMDGTGYPRGLKREQMSWPARMMAIADIFEALTAADRPYKKPKTLSESIRIMSFMRKDNHIDPDLFELFLKSGVYRDYAEQYLLPEQIDDVDISQYL